MKYGYGNKILPFLLIFVVLLVIFESGCTATSSREHPSGIKVAFEKGAIAPNFTLKDHKGDKWQLWTLSGKKVILSFWAINSAKSRIQLEDLQKFYENMDRDRVVLLGITCQEQEGDLIPFLTRRRVTYPNLIDRMGDICRLYGVTIMRGYASPGASPFPFTVFINEDSTIEKIISVQISLNMLMEFADQ